MFITESLTAFYQEKGWGVFTEEEIVKIFSRLRNIAVLLTTRALVIVWKDENGCHVKQINDAALDKKYIETIEELTLYHKPGLIAEMRVIRRRANGTQIIEQWWLNKYYALGFGAEKTLTYID